MRESKRKSRAAIVRPSITCANTTAYTRISNSVYAKYAVCVWVCVCPVCLHMFAGCVGVSMSASKCQTNCQLLKNKCDNNVSKHFNAICKLKISKKYSD